MDGGDFAPDSKKQSGIRRYRPFGVVFRLRSGRSMTSATAIAAACGVARAAKAGRAAVRAARAADVAGAKGILVAQRLWEKRKAEEFVVTMKIPKSTLLILLHIFIDLTVFFIIRVLFNRFLYFFQCFIIPFIGQKKQNRPGKPKPSGAYTSFYPFFSFNQTCSFSCRLGRPISSSTACRISFPS